MNGKYRTAVAKGIALLHSITLSLVDKEIIYSTWASVTDSGIFKVGSLIVNLSVREGSLIVNLSVREGSLIVNVSICIGFLIVNMSV